MKSLKNYGPLIILVLLIDTIGRVITAPNEIAANIILAIVGGPVMILILWKRQKMLKASQIDFSYGSKQLFNQFSLSLQENQITTLIGPNGSGKSTLFCLLTRAIRPSAGTITLDGQDIWQLAAKDFAKR